MATVTLLFSVQSVLVLIVLVVWIILERNNKKTIYFPQCSWVKEMMKHVMLHYSLHGHSFNMVEGVGRDDPPSRESGPPRNKYVV
jgi:hypothetical protein